MISILKKRYPLRSIFFFLGEGLLIFLSISAVYLEFKGWAVYSQDIVLYCLRALIVSNIFQLSFYFFDLYDLDLELNPAETIVRLVQACGAGCIVLAVFYYFFPTVIISGPVFWVSYVVTCTVLFIWRIFFYLILKKRWFIQPVLILGSGSLAEAITDEIDGWIESSSGKFIQRMNSGYKVAAFICKDKPRANPLHAPVVTIAVEKNGEENDKPSHYHIPDAPASSSEVNSIQEICDYYYTQRIIVAHDDRRGNMPVQDLLECKLRGIHIEDGISFYEAITGKILIESVNPAWMIFSDGFQKSRLRYFFKRIMDVVFSFFGLLLSIPIALITAICIKLDSPGDIFYTQERIGEKGKKFTIFKFRSMTQDAEKAGHVWALENDPRVTRVGAIIRLTRIDEIPQMWNVLRGDMSFIGPRPERPPFVDLLTKNIPYYALRHTVKPGITGWAQVCYPYGASEEDALRKLEYDFYYIKNLSTFMDLLVAFRTIKTVLGRRGSR